MALAEGDQAEQVDGDAAEQGERFDVVQVLLGVGDRRLQAEGDEHDPGDQQQVDVGVGVAGQLVLDPAHLGFAEAFGRDQRDHVEVDPPERGRQADAEHGDDGPIAKSSTPAAPIPIATIDSPRAMITISPWRSAKWPGTSFQPSEPKK